MTIADACPRAAQTRIPETRAAAATAKYSLRATTLQQSCDDSVDQVPVAL